MMRALHALLALAAFWASCHAGAQPPAVHGTIRLIVPFSAGGSTDAATRVLAQELRRTDAPSVVVENVPGAAGKLGTAACARAQADGRTLCLGMTTTHTLPAVMGAPAEALENLRNLVPIVMIGTQPLVVSVNAGVPARSVPALAEWLRKSGELTFATTGVGSISHLAGLSLAQALGVTPRHIPFKGGQEASLAAASGQVPLAITQLGSVLPHLAGGRLLPIATTGPRRLSMLSEVPTLAETLEARLTFVAWLGFFAPRGIPEDLAARLYETFHAAAASPQVRERLIQLGLEPDVRPAAAFAEFLAREEAAFRAIRGIERIPGE